MLIRAVLYNFEKMKRRDFLKAAGAAVVGAALPGGVRAAALKNEFGRHRAENRDIHIKDYLHRMKNFDDNFSDDVYVDKNMIGTLNSVTKRLKRLQKLVGHGNYSLLSFDQAIRFARNYSSVGRFLKKETDFLEEIFYTDASGYGFKAKKPTLKITSYVKKKDVKKIPGAGNYLYKGLSCNTYDKIIRESGVPVILTSGIRSVMKQMLLFLNKAYKNRGNLSLASRSLAPPGYSFHGTGDFDVGQIGLGAANFTEKFSKTIVFKRLEELGYLKLRYPKGNFSGVRFEPWHIKVNS